MIDSLKVTIELQKLVLYQQKLTHVNMKFEKQYH